MKQPSIISLLLFLAGSSLAAVVENPVFGPIHATARGGGPGHVEWFKGAPPIEPSATWRSAELSHRKRRRARRKPPRGCGRLECGEAVAETVMPTWAKFQRQTLTLFENVVMSKLGQNHCHDWLRDGFGRIASSIRAGSDRTMRASKWRPLRGGQAVIVLAAPRRCP